MQLVVVITCLFFVHAYGNQNAYGADNSEIVLLQAEHSEDNANHSNGQTENPAALKKKIRDDAVSLVFLDVRNLDAGRGALAAIKASKLLSGVVRDLDRFLKEDEAARKLQTAAQKRQRNKKKKNKKDESSGLPDDSDLPYLAPDLLQHRDENKKRDEARIKAELGRFRTLRDCLYDSSGLSLDSARKCLVTFVTAYHGSLLEVMTASVKHTEVLQAPAPDQKADVHELEESQKRLRFTGNLRGTGKNNPPKATQSFLGASGA